MSPVKEIICKEEFKNYIRAAAKSVGYEEGFGITGCDLNATGWWAAYARQSLEEQAQNNRLPEYLRTCAQEAKKLGVVVPTEYILYDAVTGEHLERLAMIHLRRSLVPEKKIAGVIFPALDRLSREPIQIGIFEFELDHFNVRYHYADAPNGSDPMSQMVRQNLAHAAKFVKLANRKNNTGGNVGRVLKGLVPAHRAAYGYLYRADREIGPNGRVIIKKAWWEIDELGPDGQPLYGSPAWVVVQIFTWVGEEDRSMHWVANTLNEMGIKSAEGLKWSPSKIAKIVHRKCYSGKHVYNVNCRVPNPDKPLGDITAEIKRTLLKPKPKDEWVTFEIPALVSQELCEKARANVIERGRGRGKQGKSLQALLRNRLFCPKCGKPMVVRRCGRQNNVYYHCSKYFQPWRESPCNYRKFIPVTWEDMVWEDICRWLRNDTWVEQQLASEGSQDDNTDKLIRLQEYKLSQTKAKIEKVREGFEGGIYNIGEVRKRISDYQVIIARAEKEILRLQKTRGATRSKVDNESLRQELKFLRDKNLEQATFEDKLDIITKLGIKVHPSEDLKSMKVACQLNLEQAQPKELIDGKKPVKLHVRGEHELNNECGKVMLAPPKGTIPRTPRQLRQDSSWLGEFFNDFRLDDR